MTNKFRIAEAVQEVSVTTSAPSVEFGRTVRRQVNVVTKSGSSQFHRSAFWFDRNDKLQAADFFSNKLVAPRTSSIAISMAPRWVVPSGETVEQQLAL